MKNYNFFFDFESDDWFIKKFYLTLQCSDIKHCQYVISEILNWNHVKIQLKNFQKIHVNAILNL